MYIKTFEDVRKFILEKTHISLFVEWGYLGMFNPSARVDSAMYILEKEKAEVPAIFIKLNDLYEGKRYSALMQAYDHLMRNQLIRPIYSIDQLKLKVIEGCPFIYWISDQFREKFKADAIRTNYDAVTGLQTGNTERFMRFWWEILDFDAYKKLSVSNKWFNYAKGGPFNKWFGNNWLIINWENNGYTLKQYKLEQLKKGLITANNSKCWNESKYFKEGITYPSSGTKGASFRLLERNSIFDIGGPSIFSKTDDRPLYLLGCLNTKLLSYLLSCLNPTVNTQVGDLQRIPFVRPLPEVKKKIELLTSRNIEIKKHLCSFRVIEPNFDKHPLAIYSNGSLQENLLTYLNYENSQLAFVLINEAIINRFIVDVYDLSVEDRRQVEATMGKPVGELPVLAEAREAFVRRQSADEEFEITNEFIGRLATTIFDDDEVQKIKSELGTLYQNNNDLEAFCNRHQINPINVWYWFKQSNVLPLGRAHEIALEFLVDVARTVLLEDEDGIVPLVGLPGEPALLDRLEQKCLSLGLSSAQFAQLDGLLGRPVKEYLEHYFYSRLSDHLNLFPNLPKTPFIWHLSSGEHQGFEAYIIIYKWTRDSLFKLKTTYVARRQEALNYRLSQIANSNTAQAQTEKETIQLQLLEIVDFTRKVDELIAEGYDPKLDGGVGKNIARLQEKGMLRADVLNAKQLQKYLNADW
jgi:hypothetical protein